MWAGGSFHWPKPRGEIPETDGILVGSSIVEETSVAKVEVKKGMVFVQQAKEYKGMDGGPALAREVRIHVFRPALDAGSTGTASPKPSSKFDTRKEEYEADRQLQNHFNQGNRPTISPSPIPRPSLSFSVSRRSHSTPTEYTTTPPGRGIAKDTVSHHMAGP